MIEINKKMKKSSQKRYKYFLEIESLFLNLKKNEDKFIESWQRFKHNHKTSLITNPEDTKFYDACEKFTELIIKTRIANEKLDQKFNDLVLSKEKSEKRGKKK